MSNWVDGFTKRILDIGLDDESARCRHPYTQPSSFDSNQFKFVSVDRSLPYLRSDNLNPGVGLRVPPKMLPVERKQMGV